MRKRTAAANRTCAFGRGSDLGGHAQARVAGHDAVRCRWGSNPAGPPTGRHCVPNSGRRCMRLTPWYCPSLLGVQEELVVVAATYSSPAYWSALGLCTIGPVGVWRASTREGKARPGEATVAGVMRRGWTLGPSRPEPCALPVIRVGLSRARMTPGAGLSRPEPGGPRRYPSRPKPDGT